MHMHQNKNVLQSKFNECTQKLETYLKKKEIRTVNVCTVQNQFQNRINK